MHTPPHTTLLGRTLLTAAFLTLLISCAIALTKAAHWPLVGDAALIRYVVFLLETGHEPYAQVFDINLPGSYLLESVAMRLLGPGAAGLRLYDAALCLAACCLMPLLAARTLRARLFALSAALLLTLIHLDDGIAQAGQRDLAMTVLLLLALVFLLRLYPTRPIAGTFLFELTVGLTLIVKPTLLPAALLPLFLRPHTLSSRPQD